MHDYYYPLKKSYDLANRLLACVDRADESQWYPMFEQNVLSITMEDLASEPKLVEFVKHFKCAHKLSIFQYAPMFNCGWHKDIPRNCSLNMLLIGHSSSITMFGHQDTPRNFSNIQLVPYQSNHFILMNTKQFHSVLNFSTVRYLLSIGIPLPYSYQQVLQYVQEHDM